MAKATKAKVRPSGGHAKPLNRMLVLLLAMALVPFSLPTIVLLAVALLPTAAAAIVERGRQRLAWLCVGGLNLAGALPFLLSLWFGAHSVEAAIGMLTDVFALLVIYGSAGIGWLLYEVSPPVVATVLQLRSRRRTVVLRQAQRRLVDQWGEGVTALGGPLD